MRAGTESLIDMTQVLIINSAKGSQINERRERGREGTRNVARSEKGPPSLTRSGGIVYAEMWMKRQGPGGEDVKCQARAPRL